MIISQFPTGGSSPPGLQGSWKELGITYFNYSGSIGLSGNGSNTELLGASPSLWDLSLYRLYGVTDGTLTVTVGADTNNRSGTLVISADNDGNSPYANLVNWCAVANMELGSGAITSTLTLLPHYVLCSNYETRGIAGTTLADLAAMAFFNSSSTTVFARPGRLVGMYTNTYSNANRYITNISGSMRVWGYKEG